MKPLRNPPCGISPNIDVTWEALYHFNHRYTFTIFTRWAYTRLDDSTNLTAQYSYLLFIVVMFVHLLDQFE